jgi:hypothetical protein
MREGGTTWPAFSFFSLPSQQFIAIEAVSPHGDTAKLRRFISSLALGSSPFTGCALAEFQSPNGDTSDRQGCWGGLCQKETQELKSEAVKNCAVLVTEVYFLPLYDLLYYPSFTCPWRTSMAEYFSGRRKVREPFFINKEFKNIKIQCTVFEYWVERGSETVYCGETEEFEVAKTVGISKTNSEEIKTKVESSIGVKGVAEVKSSIEGTIGTSIAWNVSTMQTRKFNITAPKCGRKTITAYARYREFELVAFKRGNWLFRPDFWDKLWEQPVREETGNYASIPDTVEYDPECSRGGECSNVPVSPEFDGRLSLDFGPLSIQVPYKLTPKELRVRIENHGITYPVYDGHKVTTALLKDGLQLEVMPPAISPIHQFFLGEGWKGALRATSRIVKDDLDLNPVPLSGKAKVLKEGAIVTKGTKQGVAASLVPNKDILKIS